MDAPSGLRTAGPLVVPRSPHPTVDPTSASRLFDSVAALAAASSVYDVADAAVVGAVALTGARGSALGLVDGDAVRLVGSIGYDCDTMARGAMLPFSSGLPIAESARTGRTVQRGDPTAPAWVAVPVAAAGVRGALLTSLPPGVHVDVVALERLAAVAAQSLARVTLSEHDRHVAAAASTLLRPPPVVAPAWMRAAAVVEAHEGGRGAPGGDVVDLFPGVADGTAWLLVADACGSGVAAAGAAAHVRHVVRTLVLTGVTDDPVEVLRRTDDVIAADPLADRFVTAMLVRLDDTGRGSAHVTAASAGHPPALVRHGGAVHELTATGRPVNLGVGSYRDDAVPAQRMTLVRGDVLLAHTDGLVDRGRDDRTPELVDLFSRAAALADPATVVEVVLDAMSVTAGPSRDDLAVVALGVA